MRRWLVPRGYPTLVLLMLAGIVATVFAWLSFGLLTSAMANFDFIERHGLRAVMEGGLVQTLVIAIKAAAALLLYLAFRGIEIELIARWVKRHDD